jgi:hypothetical protein
LVSRGGALTDGSDSHPGSSVEGPCSSFKLGCSHGVTEWYATPSQPEPPLPLALSVTQWALVSGGPRQSLAPGGPGKLEGRPAAGGARASGKLEPGPGRRVRVVWPDLATPRLPESAAALGPHQRARATATARPAPARDLKLEGTIVPPTPPTLAAKVQGMPVVVGGTRTFSPAEGPRWVGKVDLQGPNMDKVPW